MKKLLLPLLFVLGACSKDKCVETLVSAGSEVLKLRGAVTSEAGNLLALNLTSAHTLAGEDVSFVLEQQNTIVTEKQFTEEVDCKK